MEICNLNWFGVKRKNHTSHFRNPLLNEKKLVKGKRIKVGDGNLKLPLKCSERPTVHLLLIFPLKDQLGIPTAQPTPLSFCYIIAVGDRCTVVWIWENQNQPILFFFFKYETSSFSNQNTKFNCFLLQVDYLLKEHVRLWNNQPCMNVEMSFIRIKS